MEALLSDTAIAYFNLFMRKKKDNYRLWTKAAATISVDDYRVCWQDRCK